MPGTPVWDDTAGRELLRALAPGVPDELDRRPDVLVVGGGVVGLATAALCTRAGLGRVVLIERAPRLVNGASGSAASLLTPEAHVWTDPPAFVDLARASLERLRALDEEWDGAIGVAPLDWLAALPETVPGDVDVGAGVEVLDSAAAHAAEPELAPVPGALRIRGQGRVHPLQLAAAFAAHTGAVATGITCTGIVSTSGRVVTVDTSHGDFHPGAVVFATGLVPDHLSLPVPQGWVKGHLLATEVAELRLHAALAAIDGLVLQLPDGRLVAGGTIDEGDDEAVVRDEVVVGIRRALVALVPRAASLPIARAWCCFRPATADRQPVIDRVPDLENAWVTAGHFRTGILLAAATGDALARWIATGQQPVAIESFGLSRFRLLSA